MKKLLLIIFVVAITVVFSACKKDSFAGEGEGQLYADKEQAGVMLTITKIEDGVIYYKLTCDDTAGELTVGNAQDAILEKWVGNEWRQLKCSAGFAWTMEAYAVTPQVPFEGGLTVSRKYGNLKPGKYRLVKSFTSAEGSFSAKTEFEAGK